MNQLKFPAKQKYPIPSLWDAAAACAGADSDAPADVPVAVAAVVAVTGGPPDSEVLSFLSGGSPFLW